MHNTDDPYEILGISSSSNNDEIRKAYKIAALKYHPDKNGGNDFMFKKINAAYQFLINRTHTMGSDTMDIMSIAKTFAKFFMKRITEQNRPIELYLSVTLDEIYLRSVRKMMIKVRKLFCAGFDTIEICIPLHAHKEVYVFSNQGDEYINLLTNRVARSDIIITLNILPHPLYRIDSYLCRYDLYRERRINLYEFYNGFDEIIDVFGYELDVSFKGYSGTLSDNYNIVMIHHGYGLSYGDDRRGDLYTHLKLVLPKSISEEGLIFMSNYFNDSKDKDSSL